MVPARSNIRAGALRRMSLACTLVVAAVLASPMASQADLSGTLNLQTITAGQLQAAINTEQKKIDATSAGVAAAQAKLADLTAQTQQQETELAAVQHRLVAARTRLTRLINRMHQATQALAKNLVAAYETDRPDVTTVVLESHGFADLLDRLDLLKRVGHQDSDILGATKRSRTAVLRQTTELQKIEVRDRVLTAQVITARNQAAVVHTVLLSRQIQQVAAKANTQAKLSKVQGQINGIKAQIAAVRRAALRAAPAVTTTDGGSDGASDHIAINAGGMAQPTSDAPPAVAQVIAAGNAIAGLPYLYGGGHASFHANAYDCSGSVSYALAAAGLVSSPLDSTGFMSWGDPGPGQWITVYANNGHAFMVVDGWRFDTVALAADGTRFTKQMTSTGGFVARHPPGL